ncbi:MAG: protein-L-isoaspartate O-methyltransferase [Candidatus Paceibacterota bacterium]
MDWLDNLVEEGWLKTERIIKAFEEVHREDFLPENKKSLAKLNRALPIGYGQTISQPLVVAFMLEKLDPQEGDKILDIGSGSGWTTALLSHIVGEKGRVIGIEIISELKDFGEKNTSEYNFVDKGITKFVCKDGRKGFEEEAPYDKILASASADKLPPAWKDQVKIGGKIITPIKHSIFVFTKLKQGFEKEEHPGFSFVPLVDN